MADLGQVLALVNAGRAALGLPLLEALPPGRQRSNSDCVLARSVGLSFGNRTAWPAEGNRRERRELAAALARAWSTRQDVVDKRVVKLPPALRDFVAEFDAGAYPELVDHGLPPVATVAAMAGEAAVRAEADVDADLLVHA